jgi:hypothetical protein
VEVDPVTVPTPGLIVSEVAFAVDHERVVDCPAMIDDGVATKLEIVGTGAAVVVADALLEFGEVFPTRS